MATRSRKMRRVRGGFKAGGGEWPRVRALGSAQGFEKPRNETEKRSPAKKQKKKGKS